MNRNELIEALRIDGLADYAEHVARMAPSSNVERGLLFLLTRIGSWTNARFDQHLRDELGDEATNEVMAWLGDNVSPALAKGPNGEPRYRTSEVPRDEAARKTLSSDRMRAHDPPADETSNASGAPTPSSAAGATSLADRDSEESASFGTPFDRGRLINEHATTGMRIAQLRAELPEVEKLARKTPRKDLLEEVAKVRNARVRVPNIRREIAALSREHAEQRVLLTKLGHFPAENRPSESACVHDRVAPAICDQTLGVKCLDCKRLLGCCWADDHVSEALWNRACANDVEAKPCVQDRHDFCFLCEEPIKQQSPAEAHIDGTNA